MAKKNTKLRVIDQKTTNVGAPLPLLQEDQPTPPAFYLIPEPTDLVLLGQSIQRSTQAALVSVALGWQEAPNIAPDYYNVEWTEDSTFATGVNRARAATTSATISGLKANGVTYHFRVQAVLGGIYSPFSDVLIVTTMLDTTPPPEVLTPAAAFQNSDLVITYVVPNSEILKDVQIDIYNAAHTIHYGTFYTRSERFVWTAEQNIYATGGVPLTSVSVDIHTRSWSNTLSTTGVNVTSTAPIPSTPTGYTSNWISDSGTASADFTTSWLAAANADSYAITVDGLPFFTKDLQFVYRYDNNVKDHVPTLASGDPSFVWTLAAKDKLGQSSIPVNVTVTNTAPPSGQLALTATAGFSTIAANATWLSNTIIQDFDHYEWAISNGITTVQQFNSTDALAIFQLNAAGTYSVTVKAVDRFNQKSAAVTVSGLILDTLTIEQLRAETVYTDWLGTSAAVLQRLKDGALYDGSGAYQFYAANAGWQWVQATRPLLDRYKTITFSAFWGAGLSIYYEVDTPNGLVYYAGPVTVSANGSYLMTRYTVQATAVTNAYAFGTAGNGTRRFDFTRIEESRSIRLYFKDTASTMGLYEWYPRRLVQSDDMEAETIRSINIAAGGINADRITAITLSAIVSFIGQLQIDSTGFLWQGTNGLTGGANPVGTASTGLKIFNSSGIGKLSTYNSGVEQVTLDTDGKFKAGAGAVILDASGMTVNARFITPGYPAPTTTGIKWKYGALTVATIEGLVLDDTPDWYTMEFRNTYQANSQTNILASYNVTLGAGNAALYLTHSGSGHGSLQVGATTDIIMTGGNLVVGYTGGGELQVFGDATVTGELWASNNIYWGTGGNYLSAYLNQAVTTTANVTFNRVVASNYSTFGNAGVDYLPTTGNWSSGGTTLLVQGNDFSSIGFHDAGSRVDFIVGGSGIIRIGYDGGWGAAVTTMPGGARIGPAGVYIGSTLTAASYLIHLSADSAGKPSGGSWTNSSDERLKIIHGKYERGLQELYDLEPILYEWNGKNGLVPDGIHAGFSAQHTRKIVPEMVTSIKGEIDGQETDILQLNVSDLPLILRNAVVELAERIKALESQLSK